jgi:hypothetical protein
MKDRQFIYQKKKDKKEKLHKKYILSEGN